MLSSVTLWHPFVNTNGSICDCGMNNDVWSPAFSFLHLLAFVRVAVEDASPLERKPVPAGDTAAGCERCFCMLNPVAAQAHQRSPEAWHRDARRRFLANAGVMPLCVHVVHKSADVTTITCSNLSGECLASLDLQPSQDTLAVLRQRITEHVLLPPHATAWELVLPDGSTPGEERNDKLLEDVL